MSERQTHKENLRVLLIEDHKIFREGVKLSLKLQDKIVFKIDEAEDAAMAIQLFDCFKYDVILLDINLPDMQGDELAEKLLKKNKEAKIIALSMHDETEKIKQMLQVGVKGYLLKNTGTEELVKAISTVMSDDKFYSNEVALKLIESNYAPTSQNDSLLSKREVEILKLIAKEHTNEEIAEILFLSKRTIDTHRQNMLNKLNVRNTVGLIKYGIDHKII